MKTGVIEVPGNPTRFFLTPLSAPQVFERGLRPEAIIGELTAGPQTLTPETLRENEVFARFVAWVISKHAPGNQELLREAGRVGTGSVNVIDLRVGDATGALPPEDIFGAFEVRDGRLVRFHGNPVHKALTPLGLMQLDPWFEAKLLEELLALPTATITSAPPQPRPWWRFW